jgi:drug/metabolite transporter (DMT)-like permease
MTGKTEGRSRDARVALVAAAVTVLLWAPAFVVIRSAGSHFSAGPLALGRLAAGLLALGVTSLIRRQGWPPRAAWRGVVIAGVLWFGVYFVTLNWGEQKVDAGTASMLVNAGPILIALLSGWLLKDRLPPRVLAGLIISFAGAAVVGVSMSGRGAAPVLGVLLCLAAAAAYACGVVAQKPALRHASALQVTTFACMVGAVVCLPFSGRLISQVGKAPLSANLGIVYLGVFPAALAFTTWACALSRTTATKMGAAACLAGVVTVLLAWAFLDQVPAWLSLAGGAACLAGVAVTRSKRRVGLRPREKAPAPAAQPVPAGRVGSRRLPGRQAMSIEGYVAEQSAGFFGDLREWLRIPSVSAGPARHQDVRQSALWLAGCLRQCGFPVAETWPAGSPRSSRSGRPRSRAPPWC